ncbi:FHA domain-containing protein [Entamoeba marina]
MTSSDEGFSVVVNCMGPIQLQYAAWNKMSRLQTDIDNIEKNFKKSDFMDLLESEVIRACMNQKGLSEKLNSKQPKQPHDEDAPRRGKKETKEVKPVIAKLVIDDANEQKIMDFNENTKLPVYFGREGKEFKETGTFVNLKKYIESRTISHLHAQISYDSKSMSYQIVSLGRNGTHVDGEMRLKEQGPYYLSDRSSIQIAGLNMKFIYC